MQWAAQPASASSMRRLIVVAHRTNWGLHPRPPYTWPAVRGAASPEIAARTAWSLSTLQEQMIMDLHADQNRGGSDRYDSARAKAKEKMHFKELLICKPMSG